MTEAPDHVLLVSGSDKLHNARAIVQDLEDPNVGSSVFERFTGRRDGTLWYYDSLAAIFTRRHTTAARAIAAAVTRMHQLSDSNS